MDKADNRRTPLDLADFLIKPHFDKPLIIPPWDMINLSFVWNNLTGTFDNTGRK